MVAPQYPFAPHATAVLMPFCVSSLPLCWSKPRFFALAPKYCLMTGIALLPQVSIGTLLWLKSARMSSTTASVLR